MVSLESKSNFPSDLKIGIVLEMFDSSFKILNWNRQLMNRNRIEIKTKPKARNHFKNLIPIWAFKTLPVGFGPNRGDLYTYSYFWCDSVGKLRFESTSKLCSI